MNLMPIIIAWSAIIILALIMQIRKSKPNEGYIVYKIPDKEEQDV